MPSILDLVGEYDLLKLRRGADGKLDEPSESRYQCLKFFLEFDLAPALPVHPIDIQTGVPPPPAEPEAGRDDEISRTVDILFSKPVTLPKEPEAPAPVPALVEEEGDPGFEVEIEAVPAPVCAPAIEPKPVETEDTGSALHRAFMAGLKSEPEPIPDLPPPPEPQVQGGAIVCSPCRVAIHFTDGDVRRGTIRELRADDSKLVLQAGDENSATEIPVGSLKAMFVIAPKDAKPSGGVRPGRLIDVKFRDGRMLRGYSSDEGGGGAIFSMLPEPRQGNIEKVVVFRAAVSEVK